MRSWSRNNECVSPVPLLASTAHPLRIEFIYTTNSQCNPEYSICRNRDTTMYLTRPGEQDLPLKYAVRG